MSVTFGHDAVWRYQAHYCPDGNWEVFYLRHVTYLHVSSDQKKMFMFKKNNQKEVY